LVVSFLFLIFATKLMKGLKSSPCYMTKNREFPFCPETIIYYGRNIKVLLVATLLLTVVPTKAGNILKTVISQISFAKKDFADTIKIKVFDGAVICHMTHRLKSKSATVKRQVSSVFRLNQATPSA